MKRRAESVNLEYNVDCVLLDIEGTTTSIKFVKDELFPFALSNLQKHLEETWHTEETQNNLTTLLDQIARDRKGTNQEFSVEKHPTIELDEESKAAIIDEVTDAVREMIAKDRKIGPLKTLQGHIWRKGYHDGLIKGHIYEDVAPKLRHWKQEVDVELYVYSSGSVQAQKLLFAHTEYGDLTHLFSGHFDTAVGQKTSKESYEQIAASVNIEPGRILFLTDIAAEARAATSAGLQVAVADRPGNTLQLEEEEHFPIFKSFEDLLIVKEKKVNAKAIQKRVVDYKQRKNDLFSDLGLHGLVVVSEAPIKVKQEEEEEEDIEEKVSKRISQISISS
ncbi:Enolase-phosphatase E1 [Trinorchestia longiramus]|nr:Enolase-phosphatase E1 [Trinorchestia longiramus]